MLNEQQVESLRGRLESQRRRILENAKTALDLTMDRDRSRIGRDSIDESTDEALYSTALRLQDRETFLLNKIDHALTRLNAGAIEVCEDCSELIAFERLLARPMTTLCILCKSDREAQNS